MKRHSTNWLGKGAMRGCRNLKYGAHVPGFPPLWLKLVFTVLPPPPSPGDGQTLTDSVRGGMDFLKSPNIFGGGMGEA